MVPRSWPMYPERDSKIHKTNKQNFEGFFKAYLSGWVKSWGRSRKGREISIFESDRPCRKNEKSLSFKERRWFSCKFVTRKTLMQTPFRWKLSYEKGDKNVTAILKPDLESTLQCTSYGVHLGKRHFSAKTNELFRAVAYLCIFESRCEYSKHRDTWINPSTGFEGLLKESYLKSLRICPVFFCSLLGRRRDKILLKTRIENRNWQKVRINEHEFPDKH